MELCLLSSELSSTWTDQDHLWVKFAGFLWDSLPHMKNRSVGLFQSGTLAKNHWTVTKNPICEPLKYNNPWKRRASVKHGNLEGNCTTPSPCNIIVQFCEGVRRKSRIKQTCSYCSKQTIRQARSTVTSNESCLRISLGVCRSKRKEQYTFLQPINIILKR